MLSTINYDEANSGLAANLSRQQTKTDKTTVPTSDKTVAPTPTKTSSSGKTTTSTSSKIPTSGKTSTSTTTPTSTPASTSSPGIITSIDWSARGTGNCHAIKQQGECGACWSFASIGVMECMVSIIKTGTDLLVPPVRLSEQQLIDCTTGSAENVNKFGQNYGNQGCYGGWMSNGWDFIRDWGVMPHDAYPYTGEAEAPCMHDPTKNSNARVGVMTYLTPQNALTYLAKGPITIAISAGNDVVRYYSSGILTAADNCPSQVDHAVFIVGYNATAVTQSVPGTPTTTCVSATATEAKQGICATPGAKFQAQSTTVRKAQCCTTTTPMITTTTAENPYYIIQN